MAAIYLQLLLAVLVPVLAEKQREFTKHPESVTAPVGDQVTFECAVGVPSEKLLWRWRPVDQPEDAWKDIAGSSDKENLFSRLVVEINEDLTDAYYQCVVVYPAVRLASLPAKLSIARLDLSRNSLERRVVWAPLHSTVVLHCKEPLSEPPAVLTWWKDNGRGSKQPVETPHGVLIIRNVTIAHSGIYGCTAYNDLSEQRVDLPETTLLRVEITWNKGPTFLETEDYVGTIDSEGVLTVPVKVNDPLRLWCGAVDSSPPKISWINPKGKTMHRDHLFIESFTAADEGVYTCMAGGIRRSWSVVALEPPGWEDSMDSVTATEGSSAHLVCGRPLGNPPPKIHWFLNAELVKSTAGIRATDTDLYIERLEKRHVGIVQCFACNQLGCAQGTSVLTVVPLQIPDQAYPVEPSKMHSTPPPPKNKKNNRKNNRKHNGVMIPPSKPNVTRMSDESVMVTWSHDNHGLPIQFFKVQYKDLNDSNDQWFTSNTDIPSHIHSFEIDQLKPDRYYKFRIAAVYSNQDNTQGKKSAKFYLQRGGFQGPRAPVLTKAVAISSNSIKLDWEWSSDDKVKAIGFYVYYRVSTTAGAYEKMKVPGGASARSVVLTHLAPDTSYELKLQAYAEQAPSDFSSILMARTHKSTNAPGTTTEAPLEDVKSDDRAPGALVTAGGALGAAALLVILVVTLLLCRRAKRPSGDKEKGSVPESGGPNGYIPAKVPITITANPMHAEGGDGNVEMSFIHNNNTGNDDTLPHSRKNGPARQYV